MKLYQKFNLVLVFPDGRERIEADAYIKQYMVDLKLNRDPSIHWLYPNTIAGYRIDEIWTSEAPKPWVYDKQELSEIKVKYA